MTENLRELVLDLRNHIDSEREIRNAHPTENQVHLASIMSSIAHSDECIDDMKRKLFGPEGNTGVIGIMQGQISVLEKTIYRAIGALAALLTLLNVVAVLQRFL